MVLDTARTGDYEVFLHEARFTVRVQIDWQHKVSIDIFHLAVAGGPCATYVVDRSFDNPTFRDVTVDGDRAHVNIADDVHRMTTRNYMLLINQTHEGFIFDLYDSEDVIWTAGNTYDEILDAT